MSKVLITNYVHPKLKPELETLGYEVEYNPDFDPDNLEDAVKDLTGIVINSKIKMTSAIMDQASNLKFIARLGSGLEIIDLAAAKERGIAVYNSPEGNRNAVAEHALGMLLALLNNLIHADAEVRSFEWKREKNRGLELDGRKVGLIGFGNTGQAFAKKLSGFDLSLQIYDPYNPNIPEQYRANMVSELRDLVQTSDIISLHVPLTTETTHLVNQEFISNCKNGVVLVNTSRGKVVKTEALLEGLKQRKIKGVCMDVFENEKPETYSEAERNMYKTLFSMQNVVLSPHIAGWTHQSLERITDVLLNKIGGLQ